MTKKIALTKSAGNVFDDIGLPNPEVAMVKAELAARINTIIARRGLKQAEAGVTLGIDQAKISALHNGKLSGFSTDRLLRMLNRLGQDIEIVVHPKPRSRKQARLRVVNV
ncbi:MAG TPA: helix-turn-helix transcriptional regulator [Candidatus Hydrogenedentes bacterium]|nr:helix-turn-helix transcriptional regulator [Candidatus Hydrogenedentota bacterium]HRK33896.1 helix-turn-helix transcriptional regulator [Candidatus Hydrogenedentota bacterium]